MGVLPRTALPADVPAQASHRVKLRVLRGSYGTDKVYCLTASKQPAQGVVVLFVGDQLEARHLPQQLLALQDPKRQAELMAAKWPACNVAVVMPSRVEGCFACFDHFLGRTTASGEPLGFAAGKLAVLSSKQDLKATRQLSSLLLDGNLWDQSRQPSAAADGPTTPTLAAKASMPPSSAAPYTDSEPSLHPATCCGQTATLPSEQHSSRHTAVMSAAAERGSSSCSTIGHAARLPIRLLGFSKGGVVLNQFLAELAAAAESASKSSRDCCHAIPANGPPACSSVDSPTAGSSLQPTDAVRESMPEVSAGSRSMREQTASYPYAAGSPRAIGDSLYTVPPNGGVGSIGAKHHSFSTTAAAAANPQPAEAALLCAIKELHYLDVGLNCRGAYVTDPNVGNGLKLLASAEHNAGCTLPLRLPKVFLHGTPRQWDDPTRPWVGREAKTCEKLLQTAGVDIIVRKYFAKDKPSLAMHFDILHAFQPSADVDT